jgi:hypothetical protein
MQGLINMENIVGIVGSRNFNDYKLLCTVITNWIKENGSIKKIVSGGCKGADTLAEKYADENKIEFVVHNAEWDKYGKAAGPIRNKKIVDDVTHLIAFPEKISLGTANTIGLAKRKGIPISIHIIN